MCQKNLVPILFAFIFLVAGRAFSQNCDMTISSQRKYQVTTISEPYSSVVHVTMKRGSSYTGTAFFIHPRVLLTAGHNLRKRPQIIFTRVKKLTLRFGATDATTNLYKLDMATVQNDNIYTLEAFNNNYDIINDYGLIILPDSTAFHKCGGHKYSLTVFNPADNYQSINIAGYPGNKDYCTLWADKTSNYALNGNIIRYDFSTAHGVSGAPVWYDRSGKHYVFAIHTNGGKEENIHECNTATIITQSVYNDIARFCLLKGIDIQSPE